MVAAFVQIRKNFIKSNGSWGSLWFSVNDPMVDDGGISWRSGYELVLAKIQLFVEVDHRYRVILSGFYCRQI